MRAKTIPIRIRWAPRWDKEDSHFYVGDSWEASVTLLDGRRVELYSTRIQIGPISILLGTYGHDGFEQLGESE